MQKQSNQLRIDLEKRYQDLVMNVGDVLNIERSVVCAEHIDKTRKIYDSILNSTLLSTVASSGLGVAGVVLSSRNLSVVPSIPWESIHATSKDDMIGQGSYGLVYRATWMPHFPSTTGSESVAVKLTTRSVAEMRGMDYDLELKRATREADRIFAIAARGGESLQACMVLVHGFAQGAMSDSLTSTFGLPPDDEAFGIVMRLEEGGSLNKLLYQTGVSAHLKAHLSLLDRMRLLMQLCRGVAELHDHGTTHGDLKLENILSNGKQQPDLRIADFGLSQIRDCRFWIVTASRRW